MQIARVVQRLNLLSSAVPQLSTHLFSHTRGISVATKKRVSMAEMEILRTGPMAGVEELNRRRLKSVVEP